MAPPARPLRVLVVFAWLVVGGEETEFRLLAERADPERLTLDVVACFRRENMPEQTHEQLAAAGVRVDTTPYHLSFEDTVTYLADLLPAYDVVISCQNVADVYPALDQLTLRPPLIEHGGLVSEALAGPKHYTDRYVGVCRSIRDAAASRMPGREADAVVIPSMVDLAPFATGARESVRTELGATEGQLVVGWVGRLDRKKNVHEVLEAMALAFREDPRLVLWVIGGPDAFMPEYADELRARAAQPDLAGRVVLTGDRSDVSDLLQGMDVFVWVSEGEGMPHVVAEAGAARLPVVVTPDNGVLEQVRDGDTGLFVPYHDPLAVASAVLRLAADEDLRRRLGEGLRQTVEKEFSTDVLVPAWLALLEDVAAAGRDRKAAADPGASPFSSDFLGGFECSSHRRHTDRERVDVVDWTRHDALAAADYATLAAHGITSVRDGLRWHLIEAAPGRYDFASAESQVRAAGAAGTQVVWDLLHYGWPDDVDVWAPEFPQRFADFAGAAAAHLAQRLPGPRWYAPVNEISFLSWGGGDVGYLNPFGVGRGLELKVQLVRAALLAADAIRAVDPAARFLQPEPLVHVVRRPDHPHEAGGAESARRSQYQAWDMLIGRAWPQLQGRADALDVVGVNYYPDNQWVHLEAPLAPADPRRRRLADLLCAVHARYGRPVMVSETGTEADDRASWLTMVAAEVAEARRRGVPVWGVCLYPVLDHPGWDDARYCPNGLIGYDGDPSRRRVDAGLAAALRAAQTPQATPITHPEENPL